MSLARPSGKRGWATLTKSALVEQCEVRGLDSSGLKDALAARLEAAATADNSAEAAEAVVASSAAAASSSSSSAAAAVEDPPAKRRRVRVNAAEVARAAAAAAAAGEADEENDAMDPVPAAAAAAAAAASAPAPAAAAAAAPQFDPNEKRGARYCSSLTADIRVRITRALSQRLFLIHQKEVTPLHREFTVLGATGNVYSVSIKHRPSCTCPDAAKGHLCKHILFVMHRVLKVGRRGPDAGRYANSYSPLLYQKAYLSSELYEIFSQAPIGHAGAAAVAVDAAVKKAYLRATGERDEEEEAREAAAEAERVAKEAADAAAAAAAGPLVEKSLTGQVRHAVSADDDCAICYETLDDHTALVWCRAQCGQNLHAACFEQWKGAKMRGGDKVDCPHCRTVWIDAKPAAAGAAAAGGAAAAAAPAMAGGFLNLSAFSAAHQGQGDVYSGATYNSGGGSWGRGWYGRGYGYGGWSSGKKKKSRSRWD